MQAYGNNRHGRAEGARGGGAGHLVRDEVDDGLGLLRRRAARGRDAAPEVPQRRRWGREGAIAGGRRGGAREGEAPGAALDGEDDDAGLHRAARRGEVGGRRGRRGGGVGCGVVATDEAEAEAERTDSGGAGDGESVSRGETASFGPNRARWAAEQKERV
jgi:hypothetical protein